MGSHDLSHEQLVKRVNEGIPDPLGLGEPTIAIPGRRGEWEAGTRRVMSNGYVGIKTEQGAAAEHRLVMERELGRSLRRGESARHRNGDSLDNRPENLVLYKGNAPVALASALQDPPRPPRRRKVPPALKPYALVRVAETRVIEARSMREAQRQAPEGWVAVPAARLPR